MFCPVCESEYEAGITHCPDDNSELVERLSTEDGARDMSEARFIPLHNIGSPQAAEMVNDILTQNGIRSAVQSGGSDAFSPLLSASIGSVVLVDERDFDRAQEIYSAYFGGDTTPLTGTTIEEDEEAAEEESEESRDQG